VLSPVAGLALGVTKVELLSVTKSSSTEPTLSVSSDMATCGDGTQTQVNRELQTKQLVSMTINWRTRDSRLGICREGGATVNGGKKPTAPEQNPAE
jgi:hypothetical protein